MAIAKVSIPNLPPTQKTASTMCRLLGLQHLPAPSPCTGCSLWPEAVEA